MNIKMLHVVTYETSNMVCVWCMKRDILYSAPHPQNTRTHAHRCTRTHAHRCQVPHRSLYCILCRGVLRCNTLQHVAVHYNTIQHTAMYCSTLQSIASQGRHCNTGITMNTGISALSDALMFPATPRTPQHTAPRCNTLQQRGECYT